MSLIEWRPEFSVGNLAVDHEHRELIDLINSLHEGIRQGAGRGQVAAGLGDYSPHKEDHESLLDQLADIIHSVEIGGEFAEDELSSRLNHWFSEHFRTHDAKLHRRL
jgi:hemerythrin